MFGNFGNLDLKKSVSQVGPVETRVGRYLIFRILCPRRDLLDFRLLDAVGHHKASRKVSDRTFFELVSGAFSLGFFGVFDVTRDGEHIAGSQNGIRL